ncbi:MAG: carbon-nitrogen hydrolase family protein [Candidatus Polarisedimenticolaceae bacterium]|nr:carbon-nitrogen hydrolase family protein [Candidatus Polarisedimenticolaceae bacterium]
MSKKIRIAAAQYEMGGFENWAGYEAKLTRWVAEAAGEGAHLLLFPECAAMELLALTPQGRQLALSEQSHAMQVYLDRFIHLHRHLAQQYQLHLLAATLPVEVTQGVFRNRAHLFTPDGSMAFQDKLIMTRFEREQWGLQPGDQLKVFNTALGCIGINICYDVEFPLLTRRQREAGADIILAPSWTDTLAGYHRVKIGSQARALENQCYVAQVPMVGAGWFDGARACVGRAGVYLPADIGAPDDGILAIGEMNQPAWLYADLSLQQLRSVQRHGLVSNLLDWPSQVRPELEICLEEKLSSGERP